MPSAVAVIPARYASVRFPGKALAVVGGKPLVQHVWERARLLATVERVLVATDDDRIATAVRGFGGAVVMTSPDHPSGTDRVAEAMRGTAAELVVNLQGDEPVFDVDAVDELVRLMASDPAIEMGTLAHPIRDEAEFADVNGANKVVLDQAGFALYFSRSPIPYRRQPGLVTPLRHVGIYVFRAPFLQRFAALPPTPLERTETLEQLRALEHGVRIRVLVTPHASLGVDTPADLERLAAHLASEGSRKTPPRPPSEAPAVRRPSASGPAPGVEHHDREARNRRGSEARAAARSGPARPRSQGVRRG
jgi:3-deoxy-manno-octulosonate cytidylyltransferase (CMP-KDO synthetase)